MSLSPDMTLVQRVRLVLLALAAALAGTAGEASASELLDRNASNASLSVNGSGQALVSWRAERSSRDR